jgi:hypothetical protein
LAGGLLFLTGAGSPAGQKDGPRQAAKVTIRDEQAKIELVDLPVDPEQRITYQFSQNMRVGFQLHTDQGRVRITCGQGGETNNTTCRIDNMDIEFGNQAGRWDPQQAPLDAGGSPRKRLGTKSTWVYGNLRFTQIIEVVATRPLAKKDGAVGKRLRDTCVIRYLIENKDTRPHKVGIRNMIDTLIVNNDGAQFAVPGKDARILPNGDFRTPKDIPPYVMVLERPDLNNPGVVAIISPRLGGRFDHPNRLVLTRWPGSGVGWEVPVQQAAFDTAYAIYWDPKEIAAGGKREVGFAYGRGLVTGLDGEGQVQVALGGSFEPGKRFTVTAYVDGPLEGQTLTLELPPGMAQLEGKAVQPVPAPLTGGLGVVYWKGSVERTGAFPVRVRSSTGFIMTKTVTVSVADGN